MRGPTELREVRASDLDDLTRWRNDPAVWSSALGRRFPVTAENTDRWFRDLGQGAFPTGITWAVVNGDGRLVGLSSLSQIDWVHRTAEYGVWIGPEHQGAGHGRRATSATVARAFDDLSLRQVRLRVLRGHERAITIYRGLGFVDEGVLVDAVLLDGEPLDLVVMRLDAPRRGPQPEQASSSAPQT